MKKTIDETMSKISYLLVFVYLVFSYFMEHQFKHYILVNFHQSDLIHINNSNNNKVCVIVIKTYTFVLLIQTLF